MDLFPRRVVVCCLFLMVLGWTQASSGQPPGFVEGHLKIVSPKTVELADGNVSKATAVNYDEYPLIVFNKDGQKEVARVTADENGNYRIALPPGDYILDVQGRAPGHVRAKPRPFTIAPNQTVHVDMDIDTGVR
jgi:hypothetical protein